MKYFVKTIDEHCPYYSGHWNTEAEVTIEQLKEIRAYAECYCGHEALHLETITDTEMHFELFEFEC